MGYIRHTRAPDSFTYVQALTPAKALKECENRWFQANALLESYGEELADHGIPLDYSFESVADVFMYMSKKLRLETLVPQDDDLPKFLSDLKGKPVTDFDAASVPVVVAVGFYMGEAFVKRYSFLEWSVGKKSRAYWGQPIVDWKLSILKSKLKLKWWAEAPYIMVADTILSKILTDNCARDQVTKYVSNNVNNAEKAMEYWEQLQRDDFSSVP